VASRFNCIANVNATSQSRTKNQSKSKQDDSMSVNGLDHKILRPRLLGGIPMTGTSRGLVWSRKSGPKLLLQRRLGPMMPSELTRRHHHPICPAMTLALASGDHCSRDIDETWETNQRTGFTNLIAFDGAAEASVATTGLSNAAPCL
jgi:hypothetical protein